jgi:hypothetical protein
MIAFRVGETKQALFQNGIALIPEGKCQAQSLFDIAEAANAVFAPAIRAAARVIVRQIFPGVAVSAVILTHGAPLSFAQVRAPEFPTGGAEAILAQAGLFFHGGPYPMTGVFAGVAAA